MRATEGAKERKREKKRKIERKREREKITTSKLRGMENVN